MEESLFKEERGWKWKSFKIVLRNLILLMEEKEKCEKIKKVFFFRVLSVFKYCGNKIFVFKSL